VLLDEPTRGMDRVHKRVLATRLRELAGAGAAVLVATHDTSFAADWAERAVLLAGGCVIADGDITDVLAGGWYFAPEVARALGQEARALTPARGIVELEQRLASASVGVG
jgi:energy-coupling factor transport system ATP-binding protein